MDAGRDRGHGEDRREEHGPELFLDRAPDTGMFTFSGANLQSEVACEFALGVTRTKRTTADPLGMASVTIESQRTADPATLLLH